jgi:hypothetical protein
MQPRGESSQRTVLAARRRARPPHTGTVSEHPGSEAVSLLEELARDQHACPVCDIAELRVDVWASDEELDELLADWRASRDTSLS